MMYRRFFASNPNASMDSIQTNVADDAGSRSINGRRRHQESNSSPRNPPGSSTLVATMPLLRLWQRLIRPRTMNTILGTGSPSLIICFCKQMKIFSELVNHITFLINIHNSFFHLFIFRVYKGPNSVTYVVKNEIIQVVEQRYLIHRTVMRIQNPLIHFLLRTSSRKYDRVPFL